MNSNNSKHHMSNRTRRIVIFFIILALALAGSFYYYQKNKVFVASCEVFNPSKESFASMSKEECAADSDCSLYTYFAMDSLQTLTVADLGNKTKNYQDLKKEGYNIYNPKNTEKPTSYGTVLESLTHGEASISLDPIVLSDAELDTFHKNLIATDFTTFLRKTFDDYAQGKSVSIFSENLTNSCHIVDGATFGLSGFDSRYYKSKFVPFAVYRHITSGYDMFFFFTDKPDRLFRAWVAFDKNGNFELRTIKDSGVPKEEIDALYKSFEGILKDPRSSI